MEDAVTNAINKHQEKLRKQEISLELFKDSIDDELAEIMEIVKTLKKKARDYDGYDFTEEIKCLLEDLI